MTSPIVQPRKQRTRQHVIADLSVHHVEGIILNANHTAAVVSVPPYANTDRVYDHHLLAARTTLDLYGIADPDVFDATLQKAG